MRSNHRLPALLLALLLLLSCAACGTAGTAATDTGLPFRFAERDEAVALFFANTEYLEGFSRADLEYKMQKKGAAAEEYAAFAEPEILSYTEEEQAMLTAAMAELEQSLADHGYTLPPIDEIVFVRTTQREEGDPAAYTHGEQIYLGERVTDLFREPDSAYYTTGMYILSHELFHVLTRCNPDFRADMYSLIHFTVTDTDFPVPPCLQELVISNPDVEHRNSYASFRIGGEDIDCFTVFAVTEPFENAGESFFEHSQTCLVPIDGSDVFYTRDEAENFDEVFGTNTGYVIDPEECMADNFAYALTYGTEGKDGNGYPNPEIIEGILDYLAG